MLEELIIRSLADTLPHTLDALFLFGQTEDNQKSSFAVAEQMLQEGKVQKVLFLHTRPLSGYPGYDAWQQELVKRGVPADKLEGVPDPGTDYLHTLLEAEAMAKHAKATGYSRIAVAAAPFQQPRAFMAAVTAAQRHYPQLYLYSQPGKALPWCQDATHSQGKVEDTRAGLIAGEMERIQKYNAKGDLDSVKQVLAYLNRRDRKQLSHP
ncbi:YdcF family protein [Pontibacter mangrovi]|uniref:YdcF family protein n=1 Tax=Pontibacter mangrovi TaxID=2589816 RepID=A0A501VUJ7_9BACT|nr:YdcF family protein [Pontibacter mangrovi]TPE39464.1 YdcF family protein [Pontibacter mangrovi]